MVIDQGGYGSVAGELFCSHVENNGRKKDMEIEVGRMDGIYSVHYSVRRVGKRLIHERTNPFG